MKHEMSLYEKPFYAMKAGRKTVEVRLNDAKRRKLQIGDLIEFMVVPDKDETLTVEVLTLKEFPSFKEMYENIPASAFDTNNLTVDEMVEQTYDIYTPEREREWGTLAITVQVTD